MNTATTAGLAVAAIAAGLYLAHRQALAALPDEADPETDTTDTTDPVAAAPLWNSVDLWGMTTAAIEDNSMTRALTDDTADNLQAFLSMISSSEGTNRAGDAYAVCFGYKHTIADFSDHPAVTGEWHGESIANLGPKYAGMVSTAAGRYQLIRPTWLACKKALGLPDFSPASQDKACAYLIKRRGALDDVAAGRIEQAIGKCAPEWASLPGAGYAQPERKVSYLVAAYSDAGGVLA